MYQIIDLTFLNSFTGGSHEKNAKYIKMFLQNAPGLINTIEDSLQKQDWPQLKTSAHSLKPQISYMGIKSAEELVKNIEHDAGEKSNLESLPEKVATLKSILEKAFPELQQASQ